MVRSVWSHYRPAARKAYPAGSACQKCPQKRSTPQSLPRATLAAWNNSGYKRNKLGTSNSQGWEDFWNVTSEFLVGPRGGGWAGVGGGRQPAARPFQKSQGCSLKPG
jgi:hypothetical protein